MATQCSSPADICSGVSCGVQHACTGLISQMVVSRVPSCNEQRRESGETGGIERERRVLNAHYKRRLSLTGTDAGIVETRGLHSTE